MTLTTHGIVGTAAASLAVGNPLLALALAFASHLVIDIIPHRDYKLLFIEKKANSLENDMTLGRAFLYDLGRTGFDAVVGLAISLALFIFVFSVPPLYILLGVIGGLLPDFLQLVYMKTRFFLLTPLQAFHHWLQRDEFLELAPLWVGLGLQLALVTTILVLRTTFGP
jgi:hypothetical protein